MVIFPRIMIGVVGVTVLVILILAGRNFFPGHVRLAETVGAAIGVAINVVLQQAVWSPSR